MEDLFFLESWVSDIYQHAIGGDSVSKGKFGHYYQPKGEYVLERHKQLQSTMEVFL